MTAGVTEPTFDADGYPTKETELAIVNWPVPDVAGVLDFIAEAWHWPDFGVSFVLLPAELDLVHGDEGDKYLRLATGGWSGNEGLIAALEKNMNWLFSWRLSARGGLHIFKYPDQHGTI